MRGSRMFCQRESNSDVFCCCFLLHGGREDPKTTKKRAIIGPPAKHHLNGVSLAGRLWPNIECPLGSFMIFHGIQTSIDNKPIAL